jgi:hypothetical protein
MDAHMWCNVRLGDTLTCEYVRTGQGICVYTVYKYYPSLNIPIDVYDRW